MPAAAVRGPYPARGGGYEPGSDREHGLSRPLPRAGWMREFCHQLIEAEAESGSYRIALEIDGPSHCLQYG